MSLAPGTRLGPYEILSAIGAGGMGEVYKARDTRLDRIVAIKILPPEWTHDAEMKARFDREAQTIASLKHPNICVLHDIGTQDGVDFLVMEFLDGETLADRLKRGPIDLEEAVTIAVAVGDALDKAHRQRVIHRDLKPSNIMLTPTGPKVLDFGLARTIPAAQPLSASAVRAAVSMPGMIIGTLQYMAPEQLEGADADARTDVFALGVVLHEMITGKKAFEGKSQVLLMSAIATTEPAALSSLQPSTPPLLEHIVKTCLAKNPADRWQDVRDLVAELTWLAENGADAGLDAATGAPRGRGWLRRGAPIAAAVVLGLLAGPAYSLLQAAPEPEELRFRVPRNLTAAPTETQGGNSASGGAGTFSRPDISISPDGTWIAFVARQTPTDSYALYVRPVSAVTPRRLTGTEDASLPFWSADSRSIAFITQTTKKLRRVQAAGGAPQDICDAPAFTGGSWNAAGIILFGSTSGVYRVPAEGGKPEAITTLDASERGHFWPRFLPDGRRYLFLAASTDAEKGGVFAGTIDAKDRTRVLPAQSNAFYTAPGLIVFQRDSTVYAQPFDAKALTVSGEPARIADEVTYDASVGHGYFDVSQNGVLIYFANIQGTGGGQEGWDFQLQWADRGAQVIGPVGPYGIYRGVEVSPTDTNRVAVHRHDPTGGDIWVIEPAPRAPTRITFDATQDNSSPVWSPDGAEIAFTSRRNGKWGIYKTRSDGSGTDGELLIESDQPKAATSWSPDGKQLVYWVQDPKTAGDLMILPLDGDKKPVPFLASTKNETHAQISPDGKWIAYTSELTGRKEVYVQPFPSGTGRWQISPDAGLGGDWPRWRRDTRELFYHSLGNAGAYGAYTNAESILGPVFSVSIKTAAAAVEAGSPQEVVRFLALRFLHPGSDYHTYAVSPDGQRLLVFQRVLTASTATSAITTEVPIQGLTVAMNWTQGLAKK